MNIKEFKALVDADLKANTTPAPNLEFQEWESLSAEMARAMAAIDATYDSDYLHAAVERLWESEKRAMAAREQSIEIYYDIQKKLGKATGDEA